MKTETLFQKMSKNPTLNKFLCPKINLCPKYHSISSWDLRIFDSNLQRPRQSLCNQNGAGVGAGVGVIYAW